MKKIIEKMALAGGALALILIILIGVSPRVRAVYNQYAATGFGDITVQNLLVNDTGIYDSNGSLRVALGATNAVTGNLTVSGNLTPSGTSYFTIAPSSAPRDASSAVAITPTAIGQLVYNTTDKEICVSTAAVIRSWVEVSTMAVVACRH